MTNLNLVWALSNNYPTYICRSFVSVLEQDTGLEVYHCPVLEMLAEKCIIFPPVAIIYKPTCCSGLQMGLEFCLLGGGCYRGDPAEHSVVKQSTCAVHSDTSYCAGVPPMWRAFLLVFMVLVEMSSSCVWGAIPGASTFSGQLPWVSLPHFPGTN